MFNNASKIVIVVRPAKSCDSKNVTNVFLLLLDFLVLLVFVTCPNVNFSFDVDESETRFSFSIEPFVNLFDCCASFIFW